MSFNNTSFNFTKIGLGLQNKPVTVDPSVPFNSEPKIPQPDFSQPAKSGKEVVEEVFNNIEQECSLDNVVALNEATVIDNVNKKITAIKKELNNEFVNRADVIDILFLSVISGNNVILLGMPGTAKSLIIESFNKRIIGSKYFQWQMNKTTDPSELFGPFSIKEMENDRFVRKTDGMLPEANLVYLDEIVRGNSAVLNSLLSIMNERVFYNDGKPQKTNIMSIFASVNDMPDDELAAFTDRFVFKYEVNYTGNKTDTKKLINAVYGNNKKGTTTISLTDIKYLSERVKNVSVSKDMIDTIADFMLEIKAGDIQISDRKIIQAVEIMKASAILDSRDEVTTTDFESLVHVLNDLNNKNAIKHINAVILKFANPEASVVKDHESDFKTMIKELGDISYDSDIHKYITSNIKNFNNISTELTNLLKSNKNMDKKTYKKCSELQSIVANVVSYINGKVILNGDQYKHDVVVALSKGEDPGIEL